MSYKDFTDMPVWQKALEVGEIVFLMTSSLPKSEDYGLTSQLRRASVSISANIAEAFGRSGNKDKAKFYDYSKGSAFETISLMYYGLKVGYFDSVKVEKCIELTREIIHEINKVKVYLLKQLSVKGYVSDNEVEYELYQPQSEPQHQSHSEPHSQPHSEIQPQPQPQPQQI
jgi:four helix bundle protein